MNLYDVNGKVYNAVISDGIKLESKLNKDKWIVDNITINNDKYELYYSNCKKLDKYQHFLYNDRWYKIIRNFANMFMPQELYTKKGLKTIQEK